MIVTRLAWIAQRLVSSKRPTRYALPPPEGEDRRRSGGFLEVAAISRTRRWNGSLRISSPCFLVAADRGARRARAVAVRLHDAAHLASPPASALPLGAALAALLARRLVAGGRRGLLGAGHICGVESGRAGCAATEQLQIGHGLNLASSSRLAQPECEDGRRPPSFRMLPPIYGFSPFDPSLELRALCGSRLPLAAALPGGGHGGADAACERAILVHAAYDITASGRDLHAAAAQPCAPADASEFE